MKNCIRFDLRFRSKESEEAFTEYKSSFQRPALFVAMMGAILVFSANYIINPYDLPSFEGISLAYFIGLIFSSLILLLLAKKRPRYSENLLVIYYFYFVIGFLEGSKQNTKFWGETHYFLVGSFIELSLTTTILAKMNWKKIAAIATITNALVCFRYMKFEENYSSKYFPLTLFIVNNLFVIVIAFLFERHDRLLFFTLKNNELSLNCFKELISENKHSRDAFGYLENANLMRELNNFQINRENSDCFNNKNYDLSKQANIFNNESMLIKTEEPSSLYSFIEAQKQNLGRNIFHFFQIIQKNSEGKVFDVYIKNIIWENREVFMLLISENLLANKVRFLNEQSLYKDQLLATVSHDLRTPLNGILGMLEVTLECELQKAIRKNLTIALRSSQLLLSMINDILDFSQISNGSLRLNFNTFTVFEVVKDVSKVIKFQAKKKGLELRILNKIGTNFKIRNDSNRLKQILLNLLGNALKFTKKGSIVLTLDSFKINKAQGCLTGVLIKVEDSGIGIKKEDQPKLFKLFGKLQTSESKNLNATGIGLGLAISQSLVKILNNNVEGLEIKVESEYGKGSCFWFELIHIAPEEGFEKDLPLYEAQETEGGISGHVPSFFINQSTKNSLMGNSKKIIEILVVDDDLINIFVASSYLKSEKNFSFETVNNGADAIEIIHKRASENKFFDFILMDCNMPLMDGFEASRIIRNMIGKNVIPDLKIIACTANAAESDFIKTVEIGMNDYISKPYTKAQLLQTLKRNMN